MEHSLPEDKRRALPGDADRLIGWMRRGTVGLGGLLGLLALLHGVTVLTEKYFFNGSSLTGQCDVSLQSGVLGLKLLRVFATIGATGNLTVL